MRKIIVILILLAIGKIGLQEYLYRDATRDVIVSAYRQRAISACAGLGAVHAPALPTAAWIKPDAIGLAIGKNSVDVHIWQIDDPAWQARYRNPYLIVIPTGSNNSIGCEYDIVNNSAIILKL